MISKKSINILLISVVIISMLTGCANSTSKRQEAEESDITTLINQGKDSGETNADFADKKITSVEAVKTDGAESKVLVVYYSATGTTATVAESLAELIKGDVFELQPAEPYSSEELNWRDDNSRVSQEHQNSDRRNVALVAETVEGWESYDTVFIGYPIWWGIAAWPVNGFVEANDFTGKTVIPFCTAASSGFGESGNLLEELAGTGTWLAGERFRSVTTVEELQAWIDVLGL